MARSSRTPAPSLDSAEFAAWAEFFAGLELPPAAPAPARARKSRRASWRDLAPTEMAAHLLATPTINDGVWTSAPRLPRELRPDFVRRVLLGVVPSDSEVESAASGGTVVGTSVDLFTRERVLWGGGYRLIAGVDESGRAAWAGPLVAAAVILPPDFHFGGIGDGKVLTPKQRERAHERVIVEATAWAICVEEAAAINERGLHVCNLDLLARAVHELEVPPDFVLVDGVNRPPELRFPSEPIVRGDASSASIAAASIIAKVTRDRLMEELHATYPQYGFDRNRGYWSPAHMDSLRRCGLTPVHRLNKGTKRWLHVPPLHRP